MNRGRLHGGSALTTPRGGVALLIFYPGFIQTAGDVDFLSGSDAVVLRRISGVIRSDSLVRPAVRIMVLRGGPPPPRGARPYRALI